MAGFFAKRLLAAAFAAAALLALGGCSSFDRMKHNGGYDEPWAEGADGTVLGDVVFKPEAGNRMDVCVPAKFDPKRGNGVIVFLHAGSWQRGVRAFEMHNCRRYAKKGYFAATIDYTLWSEESPVTMKRMTEDIGDAASKLRELSQERGWNLTQMAVSGMSAGGQLALLYAYREKNPPLPLRFAAVTVAPIDFRWEAWDFPTARFSPRVSMLIVNAGTGSSFSEEEFRSGKALDAIRSVSPIDAVAPGVPPTLMGYGEKDFVQNPENGRILSAALEKAGVKHDLVMYPNSGHLLADDYGAMLKYHELFARYAKEGFGY